MTERYDILGATRDTLIVAGDDKTLLVSVPNMPVGVSVVAAWMTVKEDETSQDPGIWQKYITTSFQSGIGQILDPGDTTHIAQLRFDLTPLDTSALELPDLLYGLEGVGYYYDVQVATAADLTETAVYGLICAARQYTLATPAEPYPPTGPPGGGGHA